jgi:hypothetical protein
MIRTDFLKLKIGRSTRKWRRMHDEDGTMGLRISIMDPALHVKEEETERVLV